MLANRLILLVLIVLCGCRKERELPQVVLVQSEPLRVTDTRVVSGEVKGLRSGIMIFVMKGEEYCCELTTKTSLVSRNPRIEHNLRTLEDWIAKNPGCWACIGFREGIVSDVIFFVP